jgi:arabinofuranosyltransferase
METPKNRPTVPSRPRPLLLRPATALLLACALPLVMLLFSYAPVIDDSYISYRYAHNLASGQGLVFNPGEHVEGYTNLLWTLIMAIPEALGLPPETFAALAGVTFGVLALIDSWSICRRLGNVPWATTVPVVVFGLYPDFWLTAANGLEGGLFAFLLVRIVYLLSFGRLVYAGLCGGLLFATRPDSVLILPICAFYALAVSENRALPFRRRVSRRLLPLLAPWLALIAAVTVWRLAYYGAWLPNTIEAKSIPPSALDLVVVAKTAARGVLYWLGFLASALPLTIGAALALAVARQDCTVRLCTAILTAQVPIVLANGGEWMPHHRLLAVYAPLLAVLSGVALDRVARGEGRTRRVLPPWLTARRVGLL